MARSTFAAYMPRGWVALLVASLPAQALTAPLPASAPPAILTAKTPGISSRDRVPLETLYEGYREQLRFRYEAFRAGRGTVDTLIAAADALQETGLSLARTPEDRIAVLEKMVDLKRRIEVRQRQAYEAGRISRWDLEQAYDFTLGAEIHLLKAKRRAKSPPIGP
jgi:hypothetical protein